jgi:sulfate permease, SulP family
MRLLPPDLQPKLLTTLREGYSAHDLGRDLLAGVVVGVIALPLAIAFAIASGVRPEQGIYTAIIGGLLISVFGGSRVQIGGPTGAFVVIVAGVVGRFGYPGLAMATVMAGVLLIAMAWARLGDVIRFIPYPVTVGFTSGIALIIAAGQLGDGLGLDIEHMPADFWGRCRAYGQQVGSVDWVSATLLVVTILVIRLWPRLTDRFPGPLAALLLTTAAARGLGLDVDTVGSRFGAVPSSLPSFHWPTVDWALLPQLVSPAVTIALLAAIESLLSALVADGLTGGRHRSNAELLAQGLANVISPLFGGIPATGAIARTATNVKNGGRTPVAGIAHALTLVLILVVAGRWAAWIPLPTLAGILLVVAYNMSEWHVFVRLLRGPRSDVLVLLTTFTLTVAVDLTVAIQAGVVLASLLFMRRMADVTQVRRIRDVLEYEADDAPPGPDLDLPPDVDLFEIHGSFCFGAARKFTETLLTSRGRPRVVILRMRHVLAMDATGLQALEDVAERLGGQGATLLLSGVHAQPLVVMERSGALERLGPQNLFGTLPEALERARALVAPSA